MTFLKTILSLAVIAVLTPASAWAGDKTDKSSGFVMKTTTNMYINWSVDAFNRGEHERSIAYSQKALDEGLSDSRSAIALSNLCAALAVTGKTKAAKEACSKALTLRPGYEPALANKAALTVLFAQN